MAGTNMYGVVLWTDAAEKKAVIWCEDHGNLAFYSGTEQSAVEGLCLDAGDLIQFDMNEESDLRRARNPQLVGQSHFPEIAQRLRPQTPQRRAAADRRGANVISMDSFIERRKFAV